MENYKKYWLSLDEISTDIDTSREKANAALSVIYNDTCDFERPIYSASLISNMNSIAIDYLCAMSESIEALNKIVKEMQAADIEESHEAIS